MEQTAGNSGKRVSYENRERKTEAGGREFISVNDLLQVSAADDPNPSDYCSRVHNIAKGRVIISWPTRQGIRLPVRHGHNLICTFLNNGVPFVFRGIVEGTHGEPLPQITITPTGPVKKTQRRENFRVKCLVPVEITGTANLPDSDDGEDRAIVIATVTVDLSAGGMGVRWSKNISEGSILEAKLALPDDGPAMRIPCRIAYSRQIPENLSLYHLGIQFLAISERERARLVRYLQRFQIKSLQT